MSSKYTIMWNKYKNVQNILIRSFFSNVWLSQNSKASSITRFLPSNMPYILLRRKPITFVAKVFCVLFYILYFRTSLHDTYRNASWYLTFRRIFSIREWTTRGKSLIDTVNWFQRLIFRKTSCWNIRFRHQFLLSEKMSQWVYDWSYRTHW